MKKFIFALLAFSSLMVLSCRQQEDMMDSEDINSLKVLEKVQSRNLSNKNEKIDLKSDTIIGKRMFLEVNNSFSESIDGEGDKPPR
jgi:hypothetical protein